MKWTTLSALLVILCGRSASAQQPYQMSWSQQIGSRDTDVASGVAVDSFGNVYVTGSTSGNLGGTNVGGLDAFLQKYTPSGSLTWSRQIGTSTDDAAPQVAVDRQGNAVISGYTYGSLAAQSAGGADLFVARYDTNGNLSAASQLGTPGQNLGGYLEQTDDAYSVAVDARGNTYIGGYTYGSLAAVNTSYYEAVVAKLGSDLSPTWIQQTVNPSGVGGTTSNAVVVGPDGTVYSGGTAAVAGGPLATLSAYNTFGQTEWTTELAIPPEMTANASIAQSTVESIALDNAGDILISGFQGGNGFVAKLDPSGHFLWADQIANVTNALGLAVDQSGNVFVTGDVVGSAFASYGFLAEFSSTGSQLWLEKLGADEFGATTIPYGVAVDNSGRVYVAGSTNAGFGWSDYVGSNGFLAEFVPVPEPGAGTLLLVGAASPYFSPRGLIRRRDFAAGN